MKLHAYDHCPYCVKARMIFGIKNQPVELEILLNDDEATPVSLVGQKVVPILTKNDGSSMPESMDIVRYVDRYFLPQSLTPAANADIQAIIKRIGSYANQLVIPRIAQASLPEFATESARNYFANKKQATMGSFATLLQKTPALIAQVNEDLAKLEPLIQSPVACNGELSEDDIHLFSLLRSLSIVKGIHYTANVDAYRKAMSSLSKVPLYGDIAL